MSARLLSWGFQSGVFLRNRLYDSGWLAKKYAPLPVVSVGNIVAGGSGKTQVVLLLAQAVKGAAIVSRGYKGRAEKSAKALVVSPEKHSFELCGDEPWMLARRLPSTTVIVSRDRFLGAVEANRLAHRLVILDDGMQHRKLHRDLNLVVLGGSDPFGEGKFLPKGKLREDPRRLRDADLVVFVGEASENDRQKVSELTDAPQVVAKTRLSESFEEERVGLFCGIGYPERFRRDVEKSGGEVVAAHYMRDHQSIGERELFTFALRAKNLGAKRLLCTEKDGVKLAKFVTKCPLPVSWVRADLEIVENRSAWDRLTMQMNVLAGITP